MMATDNDFVLFHAVDRAADRLPDRDAFVFADRHLTYAELAQQSNQLACFLYEQGVRRGDRVGIFMHKSLECATAVFGIMKAGAAYVPLDPGAPPARVRRLVADCGMRVLISQNLKLRDLAQIAPGSELTCLIGLDGPHELPVASASWDDVRSMPAGGSLPVDVVANDLAYIMYTSGSTGEPKGIMHTHYSGLSYARLAAATYDLGPDDRLGNFAPLHFDQSTFDFFAAPLAGSATIMVPEPYKMVPASLTELVEEEKLTIWYSVPLALIQMLRQGFVEDRDWSHLRWILFGGEPFPSRYLQALMAQLPHVRFSNVYGPAEVNQCTFFHVPPLPNIYADRPLPIGKVWGNTRALVVDESDAPTPPGGVGELLIHSATMMAGYWNRPDLTARAFFHRRPFSTFEERYYRTGDLVRRLPDGNFLFLGRKDSQIKVRGYRLELREVEDVLLSHQAVQETAAYLVSDGAESQVVEAVAVLNQGAQVTADELRRHMAQHLPAYALPGQIKFLAGIPRTSNGKVDRRALQRASVQER